MRSPSMRHLLTVGLLAGLTTSAVVASAPDEKPTSLAEAGAAVEANQRTPEGKAYGTQLVKEFAQKGILRRCSEAAERDPSSTWVLLKLDKDGVVKEVLLNPMTKMGTCARNILLKERFSPPPKPDYWIGVYMKSSPYSR